MLQRKLQSLIKRTSNRLPQRSRLQVTNFLRVCSPWPLFCLSWSCCSDRFKWPAEFKLGSSELEVRTLTTRTSPRATKLLIDSFHRSMQETSSNQIMFHYHGMSTFESVNTIEIKTDQSSKTCHCRLFLSQSLQGKKCNTTLPLFLNKFYNKKGIEKVTNKKKLSLL